MRFVSASSVINKIVAAGIANKTIAALDQKNELKLKEPFKIPKVKTESVNGSSYEIT